MAYELEGSTNTIAVGGDTLTNHRAAEAPGGSSGDEIGMHLVKEESSVGQSAINVLDEGQSSGAGSRKVIRKQQRRAKQAKRLIKGQSYISEPIMDQSNEDSSHSD